jgi:hypothetical protein
MDDGTMTPEIILDGKVEDAFYFWNRCFAGRYHPSRRITRHISQRQNRPIKCTSCRATVDKSQTKLVIYQGLYRGSRMKSHYLDHYRRGQPVRICRRCYELSEEDRRSEAIQNERDTIFFSVDEFSDLLTDCKKLGTCDIIAAHHELMKDDPNRLQTSFLVGLVCGDDGLIKYKKSKGEPAVNDI